MPVEACALPSDIGQLLQRLLVVSDAVHLAPWQLRQAPVAGVDFLKLLLVRDVASLLALLTNDIAILLI